MSASHRSPRTDGAVTRTRILDAAGELFATTGYAETTSKAIANHAGVDMASINYHFGSRDGLYQAVLIEAHARIVNQHDLQQLAQNTAMPARDKLRAIIDLISITSAHEQNWSPRVLARELLAPSSHFQVLEQQEILPKFLFMQHILSDITGIPQQDPALLRCALSVVGPCLMVFVLGRSIPGPLQALQTMPRAELVDHLTRFSLAGLDAIAQNAR